MSTSEVDPRWRRPMVARDRDEPHRAATPLELLFDLCFVVAVAQAAAQLHHAVGEDHLTAALAGYLLVFFGIWWAWMNFTWFASAYDTDDVPYRLLTLLQMAGVLILAAGVPATFNDLDLRVTVFGYVVMRIALVGQWLRAAHDDRPGRVTALRFAFGITVLQILWLIRLGLGGPLALLSVPALIILELAVPVWAERGGQPTAWHPAHIAERYGLFTLIVLGECVLAVTAAIQATAQDEGIAGSLLLIALGSLLLVFGLWWSYFKVSAAETLRTSPGQAYRWGYAHYFVFASIAALGAGLQVAADSTRHASHVSDSVAAWAVAVPAAIYLSVVALLHAQADAAWTFPSWLPFVTAVALLLLPLLTTVVPLAVVVVLMGLLVVSLVAVSIVARHRTAVRAAVAHSE